MTISNPSLRQGLPVWIWFLLFAVAIVESCKPKASKLMRAFFAMVIAAALLCVIATPAQSQTQDRLGEQQKLAQMVESRLTKAHMLRTRAMRDALRCLSATPRHLFVPEAVQAEAYQDHPLPIGYGQTISDPAIVVWMTGLLRLKKTDIVLEIGTGSGYQAAILSKLVAQVFSIEIVDPLAREATERLTRLGYANVTVRSGDGYAGWAEHQPFDAIIITAGATHIPPALLAQLKPGGRMVMPLGPNWAQEEMTLIEKDRRGTIKQKALGPVFFVDFTGEMQRRGTRPQLKPSRVSKPH
jgi:protein-L-isoaspartate(D-aspartate) O-methyltransferase